MAERPRYDDRAVADRFAAASAALFGFAAALSAAPARADSVKQPALRAAEARSLESFQYKLQRRLTNGLSTLVSYTWSKPIATSSGWFNAENGIGGNGAVQNYRDIDSNRGVYSYSSG